MSGVIKVPQNAALQLASRGAGEFGAELKASRTLVRGKSLRAVRPQGFSEFRCGRLDVHELNHGEDALPPLWVRGTNDGNISDSRMSDQARFDLGGGNVGSARQDEIVASVEDVQVTVVVQPTDVATSGECANATAGGFGRIVVIDEVTARATNIDSPRFSGLYLSASLIENLHRRAGGGLSDCARSGEPFFGSDDGNPSAFRGS